LLVPDPVLKGICAADKARHKNAAAPPPDQASVRSATAMAKQNMPPTVTV
jgi:hypothetical protein